MNYVLIGALAGVLHGTDEITSGVDICPQVKDENLERLEAAIVELGGQLDPARLESEPVTRGRNRARRTEGRAGAAGIGRMGGHPTRVDPRGARSRHPSAGRIRERSRPAHDVARAD